MSTLKEKIQRHREKGRGRRAFWGVAIVGVTLAILVVAPGFGRRHDRTGHGRGHDQHSMADFQAFLQESPEWLERSGLGREQLQEVGEILAAHEETFKQLRAESDAVRQQLMEALSAAPIDASALDELRQETQRLASEAIDQTFHVVTEVAGTLTAEQRAELAEHWGNRS